MADQIAEFFEELGQRGHDPRLEKVKGTIRFELVNGETERWFVSLRKGDVAVSQKNVAADCTVHASKAVFAGVVTGEVNAMAAFLRGSIGFEGNAELMMLFQRTFPGAPTARGHLPAAGYSRRR